MTTQLIQDKCPNCDYRLSIEEDDHNIAIKDGDRIVTNCPYCRLRLTVRGGALVEDEG